MDDKDIYSGAAVVIPAAGSSVRMEAGRNKQFLKVSGVPILARTISIFKEMPEIDRIIVVLNPDEFDVFRDEIAVPYGLTDIEVVAFDLALRRFDGARHHAGFNRFATRNFQTIHHGFEAFTSKNSQQ